MLATFLRGAAGAPGTQFRSAVVASSGFLTWPAGAVQGDFAFYWWAGSSSAVTEADVFPGTGWVLLHAQTNFSRRSWLYGKFLTSGDLSSNISAPTATGVRTIIQAYSTRGTDFVKIQSAGQNGDTVLMQAQLSSQFCTIAAGFRNIINGTGGTSLTVTPATNWAVVAGVAAGQYAYNTSGQIPETLMETGNLSVSTATWLTAVSVNIT